MKKLRIALLFGGKSAEHEISLKSAKAIFEHLDTSKYEVLLIPMTKENKMVLFTTKSDSKDIKALSTPGHETLELGEIKKEYLASSLPPSALSECNVDLVLPIIHGSFGEDGKLQGMLDLLGIPYLGAGVLGSSIGMDKEIQKLLVKSQGIKVTPFLAFSHHQWQEETSTLLQTIKDTLTLPLFVKPVNAGSSVGITKVKSYEDLNLAIDTALVYDTKVIVEEGLTEFREIESAVMGNAHIQVAEAFTEVLPDREFYDYDSKYHPNSTSQVLIPATLSTEEHAILTEHAQKIYRILQCQGFARVDLFLKNGEVYFNEINTLPGFTPVSAFSKMWGASGVSYTNLLDHLIELALERAEEEKNIRFFK